MNSFFSFAIFFAVYTVASLVAMRYVKKPRLKKNLKFCSILGGVCLALFLIIGLAFYEPPVKPDAPPSDSADPVLSPAPVPSAVPEQSVTPQEMPSPSAAPEPSVEPDTPSESLAPEPEESVPQPTPSPSPTESPEVQEPAPLRYAEVYKTDIIVSSKMVLDRFLSNYKVSLAPQRWTVVDFDSAGAVAAMADVTLSSGNVETAIVVSSPKIENGKMAGATPHLVMVGETVYGDDGYCDDVLSVLEDALQ